jgi:hypothetical protein
LRREALGAGDLPRPIRQGDALLEQHDPTSRSSANRKSASVDPNRSLSRGSIVTGPPRSSSASLPFAFKPSIISPSIEAVTAPNKGVRPRVPEQTNPVASDHRPFVLTLDLL